MGVASNVLKEENTLARQPVAEEVSIFLRYVLIIILIMVTSRFSLCYGMDYISNVFIFII